MMLFDDLLARVPDARLYTGDCLRDGKKIMHDHGAVRTVNLAGMGALAGRVKRRSRAFCGRWATRSTACIRWSA